MYRPFFCLVFLFIVLTNVKTSTAKGKNCGQVPLDKCNVCISINQSIKNTMTLSTFVINLKKGYEDIYVNEIFNLRDLENVTSNDVFYQELNAYKSILYYLKSSMNSYLKSRKNGIIITENKEIDNYLSRLSRNIQLIEQTISYMSKLTNQTTPQNNGLDLTPLQDLPDIYAYTARVTKKLDALLKLLRENQCKVSNSDKKCKNAGKGKDKCKNKGKGKGKKNRDGKSRNRKNNKSKKITKE